MEKERSNQEKMDLQEAPVEKLVEMLARIPGGLEATVAEATWQGIDLSMRRQEKTTLRSRKSPGREIEIFLDEEDRLHMDGQPMMEIFVHQQIMQMMMRRSDGEVPGDGKCSKCKKKGHVRYFCTGKKEEVVLMMGAEQRIRLNAQSAQTRDDEEEESKTRWLTQEKRSAERRVMEIEECYADYRGKTFTEEA